MSCFFFILLYKIVAFLILKEFLFKDLLDRSVQLISQQQDSEKQQAGVANGRPVFSGFLVFWSTIIKISEIIDIRES